MTALMNCPFCGGEAALHQHMCSGITVVCGDCGARGAWANIVGNVPLDAARAAAAERWNQRAADAHRMMLLAEIDDLRDRLRSAVANVEELDGELAEGRAISRGETQRGDRQLELRLEAEQSLEAALARAEKAEAERDEARALVRASAASDDPEWCDIDDAFIAAVKRWDAEKPTDDNGEP